MEQILATTLTEALAKYEDLVFSPLALPPPPEVDTDRLVAWMTWAREEAHKRGLNRPERGYESSTGRICPWLMATVYYGKRSHVEDSFEAEFPEVARYARLFPLRTLGGISLLAQRGSVPVHLHTDIDGHWGFRFYLANSDPGALYFCMARRRVRELPRIVADRPDLVEIERRHYAPSRDCRGAYCLNSVRAAHAVEASTCRLGERIACVVFPIDGLDEERLVELLDASSERFRDSQIWYQPCPTK